MYLTQKNRIVLPDIPVESVVKRIEIPGQVEILTLSEYLNTTRTYKLNAGYTKWASAPKIRVFSCPN